MLKNLISTLGWLSYLQRYSREGEGASGYAIGSCAGCSRSTTYRALKKAEILGLVTTTEVPFKNTKKILYRLTEKGAGLIEAQRGLL